MVSGVSRIWKLARGGGGGQTHQGSRFLPFLTITKLADYHAKFS